MSAKCGRLEDMVDSQVVTIHMLKLIIMIRVPRQSPDDSEWYNMLHEGSFIFSSNEDIGQSIPSIEDRLLGYNASKRCLSRSELSSFGKIDPVFRNNETSKSGSRLHRVPLHSSPELSQSNSDDCRSLDGDADICIIEDMSHPARPNLPVEVINAPASHGNLNYSGSLLAKVRRQAPSWCFGSSSIEASGHLYSHCLLLTRKAMRVGNMKTRNFHQWEFLLAKEKILLAKRKDEAQSMKNHRTQVARACWGLRAKHRWCLSGTPIQNAIDDLYSSFRFLRYDPYAAYKTFCASIKGPIQRSPTKGYKKLQAILKTIMLRKTKGTLLDGEPIITLPLKSVELKKMARKLPREEQMHLLKCLEASLAICGICSDPPEEAVVSVCGHVFCNQCVSEHLNGDNGHCVTANCKAKLTVASVFSRASLSSALSGHCELDNSNEHLGATYSGNSPPGSSKIKAAMEVLQTLSNKAKYIDDIGVSITTSVNVVDDGLNDGNFRATESSSDTKKPTGEKSIVFSQWTGMFDLLEACLKDSSIQYRRLDGTMSVLARDKAVKDFNTVPEVTVMIISLKAASLGLNMLSACHVLLLDLWWNPTTEDQAIDRAHHIGQTRPVTVWRLTMKDTVEDCILALQQKKRVMVASAVGEDESGGRQSRLTVEDLSYLFMA
ncbi:hypothetical protein MLD38_012140 [Melastoma candidum]|uniref:Uncharacterized protein n=1 Tax=Melastoma candidum TaxID=119954 RepID=A0ACB9R5Y9_9MYRT|nr:hypothetical protein MLD38_012140 [Melastoma candidum]